MKNRKNYTLDDDTFASNPSAINFKYSVWLKHHFYTVCSLVLVLLFCLVLAVKYSPGFYVFVVFLTVINVYYWISCREHFLADSNPGVVISCNPSMVAVYTDLAKNGGYFPVIKVINYRSRKKIKVGQKIATVSTYVEDNEERLEHWVNFNPIPVEYATDVAVEISAEINSYAEDQWEALRLGASKLKKPYRLGLYRLSFPESDWEHAD